MASASLRQNRTGEYIVCFRVGGKQYNRTLGTTDEGDAEAALYRIKALLHELSTGKRTISDDCPDVGTFVVTDGKAVAKPTFKYATVQQVIDGFLADREGKVSPECQRNYRKHLQRFAAKYGTRPAESLTIKDVESYIDNPDWSSSYRNGIVGSLVSALKWAEHTKLIKNNPLVGIKKPPKQSRGETAQVSPETHAKLCEHADPSFRAYLQLLWATGARPSEIAGLRAEEIDLDRGMAVLRHHKLAHLGKSRVLFFTPEALEIIRSLGVKEGLLFPGDDGEQMTAQAIGCRLRRLCVKAAVTHTIPYGYRHSFGTDALERGLPETTVATLMGHSCTAMLSRHYAHLTSRTKTLQEAVSKIR